MAQERDERALVQEPGLRPLGRDERAFGPAVEDEPGLRPWHPGYRAFGPLGYQGYRGYRLTQVLLEWLYAV